MKRAILFDYDDTLVDTLGSRIPAIIEYCRAKHGCLISEPDIRKIWGVPFTQMMRNLGCKNEIDPREYMTIADRFPMKPFPESEGVLRRLSQSHVLGIVTSVARDVLERDLAVLRWAPETFSILITEEDTVHHKPDPRVFEKPIKRLEALGVLRSDITYIGDSLGDATAARRAELRFVGIARTSERMELFQAHKIEFRSCLTEIERELVPAPLQP
jgi:phosphoglycolate phosphatase-like HAD superfamily hydrolase